MTKVSSKKKVTKKKTTKPKVDQLLQVAEIRFSLDTDLQRKEVAGYLKQLEATTGWLFLKQMLADNMKVIERSIITKIDVVTREKLTDEEIEHLRHTYLVYEELIDKPAQLIANLLQGSVPTSPEYDPYTSRGKPDRDVVDAAVLDED